MSKMFEYELDRVKKRIERLHRQGKLKDRTICLFGVSDNTRQIIKILRDMEYSPARVIDNDRVKQNSYCSGIKVISPEEVEKEDIVVLICSFFWKEMQNQMLESGFAHSQVYILADRDKTVAGRLFEGWLGKRLHKRLMKKYGDARLFLCPYTGTGDIYLIGTFWDEYILKNGIEDYVFLVISNACRNVASLFHIKNVEVLAPKESRNLIRYYSLCPGAVKLKLLNDGWGQICSNPSEWFR